MHAQAHPSEVSERAAVWHDLVLAMHLLETALEKQAQRDGGVSHGHFKLLVLLAAAEDQTLGLKNLADSLRFSQSRISHALTALEGLGLVTRRPTVGGRRASEATLTDDGRHLVDRVLRGQRRELRDPLFSNLGDLGTVALGDLSARIITTLESDRPDGSRCGRTE
ncbi:MarR family winged helix-turn-helix transcriptional regulator [Myceligenerans xiligouense]|uniref:MarR family winged helix-turn-helix transcriptional regulator n=1 Tax=Myceligenerans xiligouense TaxID=253184 RepID=UPI000F50CE51|nr:MarR family transcriptional regulator [Myceligenerans xiligouense]